LSGHPLIADSLACPPGGRHKKALATPNRVRFCQCSPYNGPGFCTGIGAVERNRTSDLLITNQLLYQLSYNSTQGGDYKATAAASAIRRAAATSAAEVVSKAGFFDVPMMTLNPSRFSSCLSPFVDEPGGEAPRRPAPDRLRQQKNQSNPRSDDR
jgi:hypothetical protein